MVLDGAGERPASRRRPTCSGPGDTTAFPVGPEGAHKVFNASDKTVRFLMFSTKDDSAYSVYPDSNKIGYWNGKRDEHVLVRLGESLEYYDGEITPLEERLALAAIGRDGVDDLAAGDRGARRRSARTARPPWRGGTTRGRRSAAPAAALPMSGVWTSPAPSRASSLSPAGSTGRGSRSRPAAPLAG